LDPQIIQFLNSSGFKILALARLSPYEYSICLYLINCTVSGLDQIVTTEEELASLLGCNESDITESLMDLKSKNIIRLRYADKMHIGNNSMRLGLQFDTSRWTLTYDTEATSHDAIVFPFRRQGEVAFKVLDGEKKSPNNVEESTWRRVLDSFAKGRLLEAEEIEASESAAKMLVDTHPVDQVLLVLRHFEQRIPTLSLLASSWQHYQEIFEQETQKVDMMEARQKHAEMDQKVREHAQHFLDKEDELAEEEKTVLNILIKHRHPRRQLFWAYQSRSRYPKLETFFTDNVGLMSPVTSHGTIVKRD
jgi:hypothetical protein